MEALFIPSLTMISVLECFSISIFVSSIVPILGVEILIRHFVLVQKRV